MLETIHEFARERLAESGEEAPVRQQHAQYFLALAEEAESKLRGEEQTAWLERLEREHDNLRVALAWFIEAGTAEPPEPEVGGQAESEAGLRLGSALGPFWHIRGHWAEGREQLERLLRMPGASGRTAARARALNAAGGLAHDQDDFEADWAFHSESLAIWEELGDKGGMAVALGGLGNVIYDQGDYEATRPYFERVLALRRELADRHGTAWMLINLGWLAMRQHDLQAARPLLEEALEIARELADKRGVAMALQGLGDVAAILGDDEQARVLQEESLALKRELGYKQGMAWSLGLLGNLALHRGDLDAACSFLDEALAIHRELADRDGITTALLGLGCLALQQGDHAAARSHLAAGLAISRETMIPSDQRWVLQYVVGLAGIAGAEGEPERAARLLGAAAGLRDAGRKAYEIIGASEYDRHVAAVRARLPEPVFEAAWAEGRAMSFEEVVCVALEECEIPIADRKGS